MLGKLALRNVKRQFSNYMIYFITVVVTVALMFAVNNSIFSPEFTARTQDNEWIGFSMFAVSAVVALVIAFVLSYASAFMLKLRKREMGTYLTLGMTRRNIIMVFLSETLLIGAIALGAGIFLGLILYQGLMFIILSVMIIPYTFAMYSIQGLLLTVGLVAGFYLVSSLITAIYLKKVSVYCLIHSDKKVEKKVKAPLAWFAVTLVTLASMIVFGIISYFGIVNGWGSTIDAESLYWSLPLTVICLIFFHYAAAKSVMSLCLKNKKLASRGTNTFMLRQLSGKLSSNALMSALLALLLTVAVIGSNMFFIMQTQEKVMLDYWHPFDIYLRLDGTSWAPLTGEESRNIIEKHADIKEEYYYCAYDTGDDYINSFRPNYSESWKVTDTVFAESQVNKIRQTLGQEPVDLNGGFMIFGDESEYASMDFSAAQLELGGEKYPFKGFAVKRDLFFSGLFLAIVPDEAVAGLKVIAENLAVNLENPHYDVMAMCEELHYFRKDANGNIESSNGGYEIKEYERISNSGESAVFTVSILYIAVVFVFMALAMLALKSLSSSDEDKVRYELLYKLGASPSVRKGTLFKQILIFFFTPLVVPLLMTIPMGVASAAAIIESGFKEAAATAVISSVAIGLTLLAVFSLYFLLTYFISKKNILGSREHRDK